jgi:hypothetical protein
LLIGQTPMSMMTTINQCEFVVHCRPQYLPHAEQRLPTLVAMKIPGR